MSGRDQDELSPDGRTLVRWAESDGRMSHVIRTPTIVDAVTGAEILKLSDSGFDASIIWGEAGRFDISLRHYWRAGTLALTIDRGSDSFRMAGAEDEAPAHPLGEIDKFVEAHFEAADRAAAKTPAGRSFEAEQLRSEWPLYLAAFGICFAIWFLFFRG